MAQIRVVGDQVVVSVEGVARLLSPRSQVTAKLAHVVSVTVGARGPRGLLQHIGAMLSAGTHLPGVMQVGTFQAEDGLVYFAMRNEARAITIELEDEPFRRLIVEPSSDERPDLCAAFLREAAMHLRSRPPIG